MARKKGPKKPYDPKYRSWLDKALFERPLVLLDSGESLDESVFLDRFRQWLLEHYRQANPAEWRRDRRNGDHNVALLFPEKKRWSPYGWFQGYTNLEKESYYVRPIRTNRESRYKDSPFRMLSEVEPACGWFHTKPIWRRYRREEPLKKRRAIVIYLNPRPACIRWAAAHQKNWQNYQNIPFLEIGAWKTGVLPETLRKAPWRMVGRWWTLLEETHRRLYDALENRGLWRGQRSVIKLPWWTWTDFPTRSLDFSHEITLAPDWGSPRRERRPELLRPFLEDLGVPLHEPEDPGPNPSWKILAHALNSRFYVIASWREGVFPFDAALAILSGATLVAPDAWPFNELPGEHVLYPVSTRGEDPAGNRGGPRYDWSPQEAGPACKNALRRRMAQGDRSHPGLRRTAAR